MTVILLMIITLLVICFAWRYYAGAERVIFLIGFYEAFSLCRTFIMNKEVVMDILLGQIPLLSAFSVLEIISHSIAFLTFIACCSLLVYLNVKKKKE